MMHYLPFVRKSLNQFSNKPLSVLGVLGGEIIQCGEVVPGIVDSARIPPTSRNKRFT